MIFTPCSQCYMRHGTQYTKECDDFCDYAKVCLENKKLKEMFTRLGISVTDGNGNFRLTQDVLKDISNRWQQINAVFYEDSL